jgi:hypothetical protein
MRFVAFPIDDPLRKSRNQLYIQRKTKATRGLVKAEKGTSRRSRGLWLVIALAAHSGASNVGTAKANGGGAGRQLARWRARGRIALCSQPELDRD